MKAKLSDILEAFEMNDRYSEYFLDLQTGEVTCVNDIMMTGPEKEEICDRLDEHGFLRLPTSFDIDDYDIMEQFVSLVSEKTAAKLSSAITGRGAFRRFKEEVRDLGISDQWYGFRDLIYRKKAAEWCEENGVEWE